MKPLGFLPALPLKPDLALIFKVWACGMYLLSWVIRDITPVLNVPPLRVVFLLALDWRVLETGREDLLLNWLIVLLNVSIACRLRGVFSCTLSIILGWLFKCSKNLAFAALAVDFFRVGEVLILWSRCATELLLKLHEPTCYQFLKAYDYILMVWVFRLSSRSFSACFCCNFYFIYMV